MIGPAVMGWLSDRTHSRFGARRPYIAIGSAMTAIALMVYAQAGSVTAFFVAYLLIQISDDVGTGPYSSAIPELVPEPSRGKASGAMGLLQLLGQVSAVGIGLALGSALLIALAMAIVNVVCACISIAEIARLERESHSRDNGTMAGGGALWHSLREPDFRWAWFTRFLNALGFYVILNYLTNYMADVIGVFRVGPVTLSEPFHAVIVLAAVLSLSGAVASLWAGKRADRIGRKRVIVQAGWLMFGTLLLFCMIRSYAGLIPLAIVFGIGYGSYLSADWALVSDILPDQGSYARDMGVWQMSIAAPQVLSGAIGSLIDVGNRSMPGYGYTIAFVLASVAFLCGSLLVTKIKGSS
jgi:MFS family permease